MRALSLVLNSYVQAFRIIREAELRKFYIIPGVIGILLFIAFIYLGDIISFRISYILADFFKLQEFGKILYIFIKILIWICTVIFYYLIYKSLLLLLLSPFLGYISERTDGYLTNKKYDFSLGDNMRFIGRGINIGIRTFLKQMFATLLIMLLGFIFPINISIPFVIFVIQGYFTGFSFMDYTLERYNMSTQESLEFLRKQRIYATLIGIIFTLLFFIPIVGIFIAPFVTCVASTKITLKLLYNQNKNAN